MYIMWPHWKENLPLLWYLGKLTLKETSVLWKFSYLEGIKEIKVFSEIIVPIPIPWLLTSRGHTQLPNTLPSTLQTVIQPREATLWPRRLPLQSSQHTQHTLASGRAYPAYPSFRNRHTHGTQLYTAFKKAPGARLQDYKTALPANREHNALRGGKI